MATLDPRSIVVLAGLISLMMALVLFFMRRSYPVAIGGLREWTAAPFFFFGSSVFFGLRGAIPDVLSIVLANLLLSPGLEILEPTHGAQDGRRSRLLARKRTNLVRTVSG